MIRIASRSRAGARPHWPVWVRVLPWALLALVGNPVVAQTAPAQDSEVVITNAGDFWNLSEGEKQKPHRVRMELTVFYCDPFWNLLWGKSGEAGAFLPMQKGSVLALKAGQRVLLEGTVLPTKGFSNRDLKATVVEEHVTLTPRLLTDVLADPARPDVQWIRAEGYIIQQVESDLIHRKYVMLVNGQAVSFRMMLHTGADAIPPLLHTRVRLEGVFVGVKDAAGSLTGIEVWLDQPQKIEVLGHMDDDRRFKLPKTRIGDLPKAASAEPVRIAGQVQSASVTGQTVVVRDETGQIVINSAQPDIPKAGESVEVVGQPEASGGSWTMRDPLVRLLPAASVGGAEPAGALTSAGGGAAATPAPIITSAGDFWNLSPEDKLKPQRVRMEMTPYYCDPAWSLLWGEAGGAESYLPMSKVAPLALKSGQRVLLEGSVVAATGFSNRDLKVTLLDEHATPEPRPLAEILADPSQPDVQWVSAEGYVFRQVESNVTHIQYQMVVAGRLVSVRLMLRNSGDTVPQLLYTRARVEGVYVGARDAAGKLVGVEVWVDQPKKISVLGRLEDDIRFELARTPIGDLSSAPGGEWARVVGVVQPLTPGQPLTIRDESGQIQLTTIQPDLPTAGQTVEVVGHPEKRGSLWTLGDSVFRPALVTVSANPHRDGDRPANSAQKFRLAAHVLGMPLEEAARGYPVFLRGVVTWSSPSAPYCYVNDASGGVRVRLEANRKEPPAVGDSISVAGLTVDGTFSPEVAAQQITTLGSAALPEPRVITLEQALTGAEEGSWVEMRGYLRNVTQEGNWNRLELTTAAGEFSAMAPLDEDFTKDVGAVVRVAGICTAKVNSRRQLDGIVLWMASQEGLTVQQAPAADPFQAPERSIVSLRQFSGGQAAYRRVRVTGTVSVRLPGRYFLLQQGDAGLMVLTRVSQAPAAGDTVEVVGFPGREGSRQVLREPIWRSVKHTQTVQPLLISSPDRLLPEADCCVVQMEATLLETTMQPGATRFTFQAGSLVFEARLDGPAPKLDFQKGSRLQITGAYTLEFDGYHQPRAFQLQLRSTGDLRLLAAPAWWTAQRALWGAASLGLCTVLILGWVRMLRRQVKEQTEQIRLQMDKEANMQAELERATRLDSLGVLAGGIAHDFNNLLTAIRGNLGLIQMEPEVMAVVGEQVNGAEKAAKRATDVTQQLLTFAKGGDPVRHVVDLAEVVKEAAGFARHGSNVRVEFEIAEGLPPAEVDASQISRVVHNLVLNSVQSLSGGGGLVRLVLTAREILAGDVMSLPAGRYLQLFVIDNGPGIPADRLPRIFDPYFTTKVRGSGLGLATCHSIVKKHQGQIEVKSSPTDGTTFTIWLPAATRTAAREKSSSTFPANVASARVLFMDDDEVVRNLARSLLARAGHDGVLVADGAEAVTTYRQAKAAGNGFNVVILDLTVPGGMGGKDALVELRKIDPTVLVIASSGYSNDPIMANHQAFGFSAVLPKPYDLEAFTRVINRVRRQRVS